MSPKKNTVRKVTYNSIVQRAQYAER